MQKMRHMLLCHVILANRGPPLVCMPQVCMLRILMLGIVCCLAVQAADMF